MTYVGAHMFYANTFLENQFFFLVFFRILPGVSQIFFLLLANASSNKQLFRVGFIRVNNADVVSICKFTNFADLFEIFAMHAFFMKSIDFLIFCMYPGRTKQILSLAFSFLDSEET